MDEKLVKAARVGDVNTLHNLLEEDPEILRACSAHFVDSALHVAALYGKADYVAQLVNRKPSLATETNLQGMIPLHLACLEGHLETVKVLLKAELDDNDGGVLNQCLLKDEEGWTPLHCASQKGKISVIEELIRTCPESLQQVTAKGETAVHLAVRANQFGAVRVLEDSIKRHNFHSVLKAQDQRGKTAYQLAVAKKQLQVLEALKEDYETREEHSINLEIDSEAGSRKEESDEGQSQQNAILVVAVVIITLTYESMANPPSSFVEDGSVIIWKDHTLAAFALLFMIFNTCVFVQSIYVVVTTLKGPSVFPVRALSLFLMMCYSVLLGNFCYNDKYATVSYVVLGVTVFGSSLLVQQNFFTRCMARRPRHPIT